MKLKTLMSIFLLSAFLMPVPQAAALSINTTTTDVGSIAAFGAPDTATYGQTFTVAGPDTQLDSFSLYLRERQLGAGTLDLRGYIGSWNGSRATNILFESITQTMNAAGNLQEFNFSSLALNLNAGQRYVAFLSISNLPSQANSTFMMPFGSTLNADGLTFINSGTNFGALTSSNWSVSRTKDFWFKAELSDPNSPVVPEPSTMLLFGSGIAGLLGWQYRKKRIQ